MARRTLVGVTAHADFFHILVRYLNSRQILKLGMRVGVEYTRYHYESKPRNPQDVYWRKLIDLLKKRGCKIVFLDGVESRVEIDSRLEKKQALTQADAKKVFDREKIFTKRIPDCDVSFLGVAHAIRLHKKTNAELKLCTVASIVHSLDLVPLTQKALIDRKRTLKMQNVLGKLNIDPNSNESLVKNFSKRELDLIRRKRLIEPARRKRSRKYSGQLLEKPKYLKIRPLPAK